MKADDNTPSAIADYFSGIPSDSSGAVGCVLPDLGHFYRTSRARLFHRAFALVRDRAAAEDLIQEAFVRLVSEIRRGGPIRSAWKWTNTVLRNMALNHIEHAQVVSSVTVEGVTLEDLPSAHRSLSVERALILDERRAALAAVLGLLTSLEKDCLMMFADGCSYQRIASEKQLSYGVAVAVVRRSLRKVRKNLVALGHD
jgi:RNA polymerase sigma factor (sigma-70 family)